MSDPATNVRLSALAHILNELVGVVARLNIETYEEAKTAFPRVPPPSRVKGYPEIEEELKSLRHSLEAWIKQWDSKEGE